MPCDNMYPGYIQTARAQVSRRNPAVWSGHLLPVYRIIGYCWIYRGHLLFTWIPKYFFSRVMKTWISEPTCSDVTVHIVRGNSLLSQLNEKFANVHTCSDLLNAPISCVLLLETFRNVFHKLLCITRHRGCKTFFILNSAEQEIFSANKYEKSVGIFIYEIFSANKYENANKFSCSAMFSKKDITVVINLRFISWTNFMLSSVVHEKSFMTSGPERSL